MPGPVFYSDQYQRSVLLGFFDGRQLLEVLLRRGHARLQLGVGILPQLDEGAVVLGGFVVLPLGLVQLAEPFVRWREKAGVPILLPICVSVAPAPTAYAMR